jgi:PhnB protein
MTTIQPELWVDAGVTAASFYEDAFGASRLHMVGDGENVVAQLVIREAVFWVATAGASSERLVPREVGGSTGRLLLVVDDPAAVQARAVVAGATEKSPVDQEHGWLVGRVVDPYVMNGRSVSHLPIGLPRSRSKALRPARSSA